METIPCARGVLLPALILASLSPTPSGAADTPLTLMQVIEYAQQHNSDLKVLAAEKGLRDAVRIKAGIRPDPVLDLEAATGALTGSSNENRITIGISREFSVTGKRMKRLDIAERELDIYNWQLADRKRLLQEEIRNAFYDTLLANERVSLADRFIDLNRQLLEVARERFSAGDIPELEFNLVKVELARSTVSRLELSKARLQSQARIRSLMGADGGPEQSVAGSLDAAEAAVKPLAALIPLAMAHRPDLKALASENKRGEAEIALARAETIPDITAGFFYSHEQRADATGTGDVTARDNLLGIRLSMPVPLYGRSQAGVQEAMARKNSSDARSAAAAALVVREVEAAYDSFQIAAATQALYKTGIIPQLEENLRLTREAYSLGEIGIQAVIQEQKKFFEVHDSYLSALHARQTALVKLEAAVGSPLE